MINISNLYIKFKDKEVLKGIDLVVPENSVFGFVGKNGAGKTTTMKIILGLIEPDSGTVVVNGEKVSFGGVNTNKYIGYLPDVPEFYPFMTAREFLRFCGQLTNMDKDDLQTRIEEMLNLVGLEKETHRIKGFSRGMKQRLGIAQALLNRPKLLICDEPTTALDPVGRKEFLDTLKSVSIETTVLFSTHILSDVERICTDVAILDDGVIKVHGKLSDVKAKFEKEEVIIELKDEETINLLLNNFDLMMKVSNNIIKFDSSKLDIYSVLEFVTNHKISFTRIEKMEPNLESLFMEVVK